MRETYEHMTTMLFNCILSSYDTYFNYSVLGGTGMIASSSTFRPHPVRHCTEALVYSNHPRAAAASSFLAIILGRIATTLVPWLNSGADAAPASVLALV